MRELERRNRNSLLVSAGDLIGASPLVSALYHDEPTIEAMNKIGLDLNAVGNHEFDDGEAELKRMQRGGCHPADKVCDGFEGADFKFLAANVVRKDNAKTLFRPYTGCVGRSGAILDIVNNTTDAVDLFVTGHTHQPYDCVVDGRPVTSASSAGRLITDIDLRIGRSGDVPTCRPRTSRCTRRAARR